MSRCDWVPLLILAPATLDLDAWPVESTRGAGLLCRDVLAGPPAYQEEDWSQPDGLGDWVQPSQWLTGTVSPTPSLAQAVAWHYGKRPGVPGRLGARIYYAQLSDWAGQAADVAAGVQLAAGVAGDDWPPPYVVVLLREPDAQLTALLGQMLPGVPVRYVPDVSPEAIAAAINDGLAELGAP